MPIYLIAGIFLLQLGDYWTTSVVLKKGGVETNPVVIRAMAICGATVELSIGGTTTVSADYYSFTLPSSARADRGWNCTGSYYDASTATSYVFSGYVVRSGSNNTVRLVVNGVAGSPYVSSTIPVVPAVNDYLTFTIAYEEA